MKYTKIVINANDKNYFQATTWCKESFGQSRPPGTSFGNMRWWKKDIMNPEFSYYPSGRAFYFREEKDATLFRIMWS